MICEGDVGREKSDERRDGAEACIWGQGVYRNAQPKAYNRRARAIHWQAEKAIG